MGNDMYTVYKSVTKWDFVGGRPCVGSLHN